MKTGRTSDNGIARLFAFTLFAMYYPVFIRAQNHRKETLKFRLQRRYEKTLKYRIILCLLSTFALALPIIIKPLTVQGCANPLWYHYILVFIVLPLSSWITLGFGFKKMIEHQLKSKEA